MARIPRPCLDCQVLTRNATRCDACTALHKATHKRARAAARPAVEAGAHCCVRCGMPIYPMEAWDIDQTATGWRPSHRRCNRAPAAGAGGRG